MAEEEETTPTTYEQLAAIEEEFDNVDTEICKRLPTYLSSCASILVPG